MPNTPNLSDLIAEVSQFEREPEPLPWAGASFRDRTEQQTDTFTLKGSVGPFVDHYVLDRERGDGTGTRIVRHFTLVEPVGADAGKVNTEMEMYHSAMDVLGEALGRRGDDIVDNDLLHLLAHASRSFEHLERNHELSTTLSIIGDIYDRIGNPAHALQFRQAAEEAADRSGEKSSSIRTLKRKLQLAGSQLQAGDAVAASEKLRPIVQKLKNGFHEYNSEYWDVFLGAGVYLFRALREQGRSAEARTLAGDLIQHASGILGGSHEMVRMAKELLK